MSRAQADSGPDVAVAPGPPATQAADQTGPPSAAPAGRDMPHFALIESWEPVAVAAAASAVAASAVAASAAAANRVTPTAVPSAAPAADASLAFSSLVGDQHRQHRQHEQYEQQQHEQQRQHEQQQQQHPLVQQVSQAHPLQEQFELHQQQLQPQPAHEPLAQHHYTPQNPPHPYNQSPNLSQGRMSAQQEEEAIQIAKAIYRPTYAPGWGPRGRLAQPTSWEPLSTPGAFAPKRRGRPPGRPNTHVREADFENDPLVRAWNQAKLGGPLTITGIRIEDALRGPRVDGDKAGIMSGPSTFVESGPDHPASQLPPTPASDPRHKKPKEKPASLLQHDSQQATFRIPGREIIYFVSGWITAKHIAQSRPSYVNALLIHSRGTDVTPWCKSCVDRRDKGALGPFVECRNLAGYFHGSCSNCKWFDNTSACSLYRGPAPNRKRKAKDVEGPGLEPGPETDANASTSSNPAFGASNNGFPHQKPQFPASEADLGALAALGAAGATHAVVPADAIKSDPHGGHDGLPSQATAWERGGDPQHQDQPSQEAVAEQDTVDTQIAALAAVK